MSAAPHKTHPPARGLTRAEIRHRLAVPREVRPRGDDATAQRLLESPDVQPFDRAKHDPANWGGALGVGLPGKLAPLRREGVVRTPAAVLVPLVEHAQGFTVLFTQRTAGLKSHAGQISFPGGRMEPGDADADAGALRETAEEIGLAARHIEVLGPLDPYWTVTNYEVMPVVAAITPPFDLALDPAEVADVFEVPLSFFLDTRNHQIHSRTIGEGKARAYYAMPYGDRYIWGATAGMLVNLYEVLTAGG